MLFSEMNWMDVERYLAEDDRLMMVLGSTEQHAYLSLATDTLIPLKMAEAASEQSGVPVAPPLYYGISPYFLAYPGTLSLRMSTLMAVVEDVVRSAYGAGFRRMLVVNGHGGNQPTHNFLYELANELEGLDARWFAWWRRPVVGEIAEKHGLVKQHANWSEAFGFTRVGDLPEGEKPLVDASGVMSAAEARARMEDGSFGGAYRAEEVVMEEIFAACVAELVEMVKFV